jgi:uncharacterized protein (UPF0335 family)
LTDTEHDLLAQSRDHLIKFLREEEKKYFQREKVKDVLLRDNNTGYFQMIVNDVIFSLERENEEIEDQANLKTYMVISPYFTNNYLENLRRIPS